jgi:hypothetical protein
MLIEVRRVDATHDGAPSAAVFAMPHDIYRYAAVLDWQ